MTGENGHAVPKRAVPDFDGLVVGGRDLRGVAWCERVTNAMNLKTSAYNPHHFMMELGGADAIQVPVRSKKDASSFKFILW